MSKIDNFFNKTWELREGKSKEILDLMESLKSIQDIEKYQSYELKIDDLKREIMVINQVRTKYFNEQNMRDLNRIETNILSQIRSKEGVDRIKVESKKILLSIEIKILKEIDRFIEQGLYPNRTRAINSLLKKEIE